MQIGYHNNTALAANLGKLFVEIDDSVAPINIESTSRIDDGEFHHITVTLGLTPARTLKLYVDGKEENNASDTTSGAYAGTHTVKIGNATQNFSGVIDEVAYWSRELHPSEVLQAYQRGANRIKFLVRSCIDINCDCRDYNAGGSATDCDGDGQLNLVDTDDSFKALWLGLNSTYELSELQNNTLIDVSGQSTGFVNSLLPDLEFANFAPAGFSLQNNRYFQFRTILESSDTGDACLGSTTCLPTLSSVSIGSNNFFGGPQEVTSIKVLNYADEISDIFFDELGGNCSFTYQLSNDAGATWYYYNTGSSQWLTGGSSSNESSIRSGIGSFHLLPGSKDLAFRAFIESVDTTSDCRINEIEVTFTN